MNASDEARKWLALGYETYGPSGVRAMARAMGLPSGRPDVTSIGNAIVADTTGSGVIADDGQEHPSTASNPARSRTRAASQSVSACPTRPPRAQSGWRSYDDSGDPDWFHCGYEGYLENRQPTSERPIAECFYDEQGKLVDESHPYAGCRGTPDSYPGSDWWNHIFADPGGIKEQGWPAFLESRRHAADDVRELLRKHGIRPHSIGPFRAPLPR